MSIRFKDPGAARPTSGVGGAASRILGLTLPNLALLEAQQKTLSTGAGEDGEEGREGVGDRRRLEEVSQYARQSKVPRSESASSVADGQPREPSSGKEKGLARVASEEAGGASKKARSVAEEEPPEDEGPGGALVEVAPLEDASLEPASPETPPLLPPAFPVVPETSLVSDLCAKKSAKKVLEEQRTVQEKYERAQMELSKAVKSAISFMWTKGLIDAKTLGQDLRPLDADLAAPPQERAAKPAKSKKEKERRLDHLESYLVLLELRNVVMSDDERSRNLEPSELFERRETLQEQLARLIDQFDKSGGGAWASAPLSYKGEWTSLATKLKKFEKLVGQKLLLNECVAHFQVKAEIAVQVQWEKKREEFRALAQRAADDLQPGVDDDDIARDFPDSYIVQLLRVWNDAAVLNTVARLEDPDDDNNLQRLVAFLTSVLDSRAKAREKLRNDFLELLDTDDRKPGLYRELKDGFRGVRGLSRDNKQAYDDKLENGTLLETAMAESLVGTRYSSSEVDDMVTAAFKIGLQNPDLIQQAEQRKAVLRTKEEVDREREDLIEWVKDPESFKIYLFERRLNKLKSLDAALRQDGDDKLITAAEKALGVAELRDARRALKAFVDEVDRSSPVPFGELVDRLREVTTEAATAALKDQNTAFIDQAKRKLAEHAVSLVNEHIETVEVIDETLLDLLKELGVDDEDQNRALQHNTEVETEGATKLFAHKYLWSGKKLLKDMPAKAVFVNAPDFNVSSDAPGVFDEWMACFVRPRDSEAGQQTSIAPFLQRPGITAEDDPTVFRSEAYWFSTWREKFLEQQDESEAVKKLLELSKLPETDRDKQRQTIIEDVGRRATAFEEFGMKVASKQIAMDRVRADRGILSVDETLPRKLAVNIDLANMKASLLQHRMDALEAQKLAIRTFERKNRKDGPVKPVYLTLTGDDEEDKRAKQAADDLADATNEVRQRRQTIRVRYINQITSTYFVTQGALSAALEEGASTAKPDAELQKRLGELVAEQPLEGDDAASPEDKEKRKLEMMHIQAQIREREHSRAEKKRAAEETAKVRQNYKVIEQVKRGMETSFVTTAAAFITFDDYTAKAQSEYDKEASRRKSSVVAHTSAADAGDLSLLAVPFTPEQLRKLFFDSVSEPTARKKSWERLLQRGSTGAIQISDITSTPHALFDRSYAISLLEEHLLALHALDHEADAGFTKLGSCLGAVHTAAKRTAAAKKLVPFFESMLRYRNTMVAVKLLLIKDEDRKRLAMGNARDKSKARPTHLDNAKKALEQMTGDIPPAFCVYARRLIAMDQGRFPDSLVRSQPAFLPLRIFAPPRVGKSATALMAASLAKRLGMLTLYACAPNKKTPIREWREKLQDIGWTRHSGYDTTGQAADERKHLLQYEADTVTDFFTVQNKDLAALVRRDMYIYSHDGPLKDLQQAGAILGALKMSSRTVFHIRDEAQFLTKEDVDDATKLSAHHDALPPPELLSLRHYYGNLYGLNCLVSATLFPTLAEEQLWGFYGSMSQNMAVGMNPVESLQGIMGRVGANFLPLIVPALRPAVPETYMGREKIVTWQHRGEEVYLAANTTSQTAIEKYGAATAAPKQKGKWQAARKMLPRNQTIRAAHGDTASQMNHDYDAICKHFEEWYHHCDDLIAAQESEGGGEPCFLGKSRRLANGVNSIVPTYVGALHRFVIGDGLCSWIRAFAAIAHRAYVKEGEAVPREASQQRENEWGERVCRKYGVNFVLFTSTMGVSGNNIATLIKELEEKGGLKLTEDLRVEKSREPNPDGSGSGSGENECVVLTYDPSDPENRTFGLEEPYFGVRLAHSVQNAIRESFPQTRINRYAILGYSKLKAGLTVQVRTKPYHEVHDRLDEAISGLEEAQRDLDGAKDRANDMEEDERKKAVKKAESDILRHERDIETEQAALRDPKRWGKMLFPERQYCPAYIAVSTAETTSLDSILQLVGRSFVDLKTQKALDWWKIQLLTSKEGVDRLKGYSLMEDKFAGASDAAPTTMCKALKDAFNKDAIKTLGMNPDRLGTLGVRESEFQPLLGIGNDPDLAAPYTFASPPATAIVPARTTRVTAAKGQAKASAAPLGAPGSVRSLFASVRPRARPQPTSSVTW